MTDTLRTLPERLALARTECRNAEAAWQAADAAWAATPSKRAWHLADAAWRALQDKQAALARLDH